MFGGDNFNKVARAALEQRDALTEAETKNKVLEEILGKYEDRIRVLETKVIELNAKHEMLEKFYFKQNNTEPSEFKLTPASYENLIKTVEELKGKEKNNE